MAGKRGLVMGVANDHSIAWGIAKALREQGAELAFTYQGEAFGKRVRPLAGSLGSNLVLPCDVEDDNDIERVFTEIDKAWGSMDFLVHAIAYSDKEELKGRYLDTTRRNFARTLAISCYSFTALAKQANVMGVAKAALEASVRYLSADLGPQGVRVNAISAGPMRTLAGSAIADARFVYRWNQQHAPLRRNVLLEEVGAAGLYLLSDLSSAVTGEVHYVDGGYNLVGIPSPARLVDGET
jgi:enoyl-[acyl-carrier protein] reductase I